MESRSGNRHHRIVVLCSNLPDLTQPKTVSWCRFPLVYKRKPHVWGVIKVTCSFGLFEFVRCFLRWQVNIEMSWYYYTKWELVQHFGLPLETIPSLFVRYLMYNKKKQKTLRPRTTTRTVNTHQQPEIKKNRQSNQGSVSIIIWICHTQKSNIIL